MKCSSPVLRAAAGICSIPPFSLNCFDFQALWRRGGGREFGVGAWWGGGLVSPHKSPVKGEGSDLILTHSCRAWPGSSWTWDGGVHKG